MANSQVDKTVNIANAKVGDIIQSSPNSANVPAGITWCAFCAADGSVTVRVSNPTTTAVSVGNLVFKVLVIN
ncbi:hypothetical protein ABEY80_15815 [Priestia megaterium]